MTARREWVVGMLAALLTVTIVAGSFIISAQETQTALAEATSTSTFTGTPFISPTPVPTQKPGEPTYTPTNTPLPPTITPSPLPPTSCPPPVGWVKIDVGAGETIESLAEKYGTTPQALLNANCLESSSMIPGLPLYVPPSLPTATNTLQMPQCGPPPGWGTLYTVKPGDTLSKISRDYGVSVYEIQLANCLGSSTLIRAGQLLTVPNWPSQTPIASVTPTFTRTPRPTETVTSTPIPPTASYTPTPTVSPTIEVVTIVVPSGTPSPTATSTPTNTAIPPDTPTATFTPTMTSTPTPTSTSTEPPSPTPPPTRTPTNTPDGG